jgi:hypothetical protein
MEMVYAVFDDTDAVEDYEIQKMEAEDPIAFAASRGDPDTLSYKDVMGAIDSPGSKLPWSRKPRITLLEKPGRFGRRETYLRVTRSSLLSGLSSGSDG